MIESCISLFNCVEMTDLKNALGLGKDLGKCIFLASLLVLAFCWLTHHFALTTHAASSHCLPHNSHTTAVRAFPANEEY